MWQSVSNTERKFGSALTYWHATGPYGEPILLTDVEVARGMERAKRNPEDLPARTTLVPVEMTP